MTIIFIPIQSNYLFSRYNNMENYEIIERLAILVSGMNTETTYIMARNDPLNFWAIGSVYSGHNICSWNN